MSRWRVPVSPERLLELRRDEAFAELLTLARMSTALRFAVSAGFKAGDGVVGERARLSSFLLTAATCAEALHTIQRMGKHFRDFPAYKASVTPLLTTAPVRDLRSKVLKWLRDKAVFHHDKDVALRGLADLEGAWTFAEADSDELLDVGYPLADFVIIRAVLHEIDVADDLIGGFEDVLNQTLQLTHSLLEAIDSLIGQALNAQGFAMEEKQENT